MTQYARKTLENILNNIKSACLTKSYFMEVAMTYYI